MYGHMYAQVKQKHKLSQKFGISIGTRQGCNMSPTLFKMFLCDLPGIFRDPKCDPVTLLDDRLSCLLYAADIVILSKSANGLQLSLDKPAEYCHKWRLNVNYKKSKILIFHKRKINSKFTFNKHELDISTSYEYLGITFQRDGSFRTAIQVLSRKATKAYYSLMKTFSNTNSVSVFLGFKTKLLHLALNVNLGATL